MFWFHYIVQQQHVTRTRTKWSIKFANVPIGLVSREIINSYSMLWCVPKRSSPPKRHRHSSVDWKIIHHSHHIALDFLGPLPTSNGAQFILLIGDLFENRYYTIPFFDQQSLTSANVFPEHWICRVKYPYSIKKYHGRKNESQLFKHLMKLLQFKRTRTTTSHTQSTSFIERMDRILLNMLTTNIHKEQDQWFYFLPFVLMAYRSSVQVSMDFTHNLVVLGHELLLTFYLKYPLPGANEPINSSKHVMQKQVVFEIAFELVRRNTTSQQKPTNALNYKNVLGPRNREGDYILLLYAVTVTGHKFLFSSIWKSPYGILKSINDVNYKNEELKSRKQMCVHYNRFKPCQL